MWLKKTFFLRQLSIKTYEMSPKIIPKNLSVFHSNQMHTCKATKLQGTLARSRSPEVFLGKGALKICSKFTGEFPCRIVISIKLLCKFIEVTLWHGCSPVNLQHILRIRTPLEGCF